MATRMGTIGRTPVNLNTLLSMVDGQTYIAQNTANSSERLLYIAEVDDSSPDPVRGAPALELNIDQFFSFKPIAGKSFWAWTHNSNHGELTISEAR